MAEVIEIQSAPAPGLPTLRIRQLEGSRKVLVLSRLAGPLAGATWGVRQRGEVMRAPGNSVGRALLLGGEDQSTEFEFRWLDRRLINSRDALLGDQPIETADELVRQVRLMVRESALVSVEWRGNEQLGMLREVEPTEGRLGDYEVTLEVEWIAASTFQALIAPTTMVDPSDTYEDLLEDWTQTIRDVVRPLTMAADKVEDMERAVGTVNTALRRAGAIALELQRGVTAIAGVRRSMAGALSGVATAAKGLADSVSLGGAEIAQTTEPRAVIQSYVMRSSLQRQAYRMRRMALLAAGRMAEDADPDLYGIHLAVQGEDLRMVAVRQYGSLDVWRDLARYNGLTGTRLVAGQRIRLPRFGVV